MDCPHCKAEIGAEAVGRMLKESEVRAKIHPKPGELLSSKTVGGFIENFGAIFFECGKSLGVKTDTLIKSVTTDESGAVEITMMVVRLEVSDDVPRKSEKKQKEMAL